MDKQISQDGEIKCSRIIDKNSSNKHKECIKKQLDAEINQFIAYGKGIFYEYECIERKLPQKNDKVEIMIVVKKYRLGDAKLPYILSNNW